MKNADPIRNAIRRPLRNLAGWIDRVSNGKINANHVTWFSLVMHIPIAWAIFEQQWALAAFLLLIFGLMDALDGELARLQNKASDYGVFLDASTDRIKEAMVYLPLVFVFANNDQPEGAMAAALALSGALTVSYIKARGEAVLSEANLSSSQINRVFSLGFAKYEVRMAIMVLGFAFSMPLVAVTVVAISAWLTAFYRLLAIGQQLK